MGGGENNFRGPNNGWNPQKEKVNGPPKGEEKSLTSKGDKEEFFLKRFYVWLKRNAFWVGFLGTSLFIGAVVLTYNLLVEEAKPTVEKVGQTYQPTLTELKKQVFEVLKRNNQKILSQAYKAGRPDIKKLEAQNLKEVQTYIERKLTSYFNKVETKNVETFLNWFYAFGTDYKVIFRRAEDTFNAVKCKTGHLESCFKVSATEKYIETQIDKYLLNKNNLQRYLETEVMPYLREKLKEFARRSLEIVKTHYRKEAQRLLKEEFKNVPTDTLRWITDSATRRMAEKVVNLTETEINRRIERKLNAMVTTALIAKITGKVVSKISYKLTVKITQKVAAKSAEKVGARFFTGFGGGVLACSALGPFSLVCGVAAGVAATVATDYALTKLDEAFTRDDMRRELVKLLEEAKKDLITQLVEFHKTNLQAVETVLEELLREGNYTLRQVGK